MNKENYLLKDTRQHQQNSIIIIWENFCWHCLSLCVCSFPSFPSFPPAKPLPLSLFLPKLFHHKQLQEWSTHIDAKNSRMKMFQMFFQFGDLGLYIFFMLIVFHGQSETPGCSWGSWHSRLDTFRYLQGMHSTRTGYISSYCVQLGPCHSQTIWKATQMTICRRWTLTVPTGP